MQNQFGGQWTEEKLDRVRRYLIAYLKIMHGNENARFFRTVYFDAFAGTGSRQEKRSRATEQENNFQLFADDEAAEVQALQKGSAELALEIDPGFDQYILIDQNSENAQTLTASISSYCKRGKNAFIKDADANEFIPFWCEKTDWNSTRCVMFLDPFGLQVEWSTLKSIADTKGIDLWLLFPLGQGVNRMLTRRGAPPSAWADRLTSLFGTEKWKERFYRERQQSDMFGDTGLEKAADFDTIKLFFIEQLKTIFPHVAKNPLTLYNSKNCPIFLLCFAACNEKGGKTALKIANHLLKA